MAQLLSLLALRHELALLTLRGPGDLAVDPVVARRSAIVTEIPRPGGELALFGRWKRLAQLGLALPGGTPAWAVDWRIPRFAEELRSVTRSWTPDVVQAEFGVMGQYLAAVPPPARRLLVEHDPGHRAAVEALRAAHGFARLPARAEVRSWSRYEQRVLANVDAAAVFTEYDRRALVAASPGLVVRRLRLGADLPEAPLDPLGTDPPTLLFVGSYDHPPNVDAALRLATGIFPRVTSRRPDARLVLVGPAPPPRLRAAATAGVEVTGLVDEVRPYLDRAAVVVAPLRLGGGMRVKVLEALAAGKATVASRLAVEGLDVADGRELLVADSDEEFADQILRLLGNPVERETLASEARRWAEQNLGWDAALDALDSLYDRLVESRA